MPSPVQSNCDAHDTIANGQYGAVWSMGHTQQMNPDHSLGCILDISRIFGNCIKAEYIASWGRSQFRVVSSSLVRINLIVCLTEQCIPFELRDKFGGGAR
ncbi:hypothetical protein TNCV_5008961 [Trichonephila clavipes]|nr:hypothetical protein TNCV_5008961 [Trichonephila clavipes]